MILLLQSFAGVLFLTACPNPRGGADRRGTV